MFFYTLSVLDSKKIYICHSNEREFIKIHVWLILLFKSKLTLYIIAMKKNILLLLVSMALLSSTTLAQTSTTCTSCTVTLTGSSSYTISTGQKACLPLGNTFTGNITVNGGSVESCGTFNPQNFSINAGTVTINGSATLSSCYTNSTSAVFTNNGTVTFGNYGGNGQIVNNGTMTFTNDLNLNTGSSLTNNNILTLNGSLNNNAVFVNLKTVSIAKNLSLNSNATLTNSGNITVLGACLNNAKIVNNQTITVSGTVTNNSGATLINTQILSIKGILTNNGTLTNTGNVTSANTNDIKLPTISISSSPTICSGTSVVLTASGGTSYKWSNAASTASIIVTPTVTTSYTVTGTNASGYSAVVSTTVTVNAIPTISILASQTICSGSNAILTASGAASYRWSNSATTASITATPLITSSFTVTGISVLGCINTMTKTIIVNQTPTISVDRPILSFCSDNSSSTSVNASGASTYQWSNGLGNNATATFTPQSNIVYTVTGTNTKGCLGTATVTITMVTIPTVTINPSNSKVYLGSSITLSANGANSYSWYNADNSAIIGTGATFIVTPIATQSYTVIGQTSCSASANTTVIVDTLVPFQYRKLIIDNNGKQYSMNDLKIPTNSHFAGMFLLHFEEEDNKSGTGFDDHSNVIIDGIQTELGAARRNVLIQVCKDLSALLSSNVNHGVGSNSNAVQILITNYVASSAATPFYIIGQGVTETLIQSFIKKGQDPYIKFSALLGNNTTGLGYYHGSVNINLSDDWNLSMQNASDNLHYDLYTVFLHEMMHSLGVNSLIAADGSSKISNSIYTLWDTFLTTNGVPVVSSDGNTSTVSAAAIPEFQIECNQSDKPIMFTNTNINLQVPVITTLYVDSKLQFSPNVSLSHIGCNSDGIDHFSEGNYVMFYMVKYGTTKRFLNPDEVKILLSLGYTISGTYGDDGVFYDVIKNSETNWSAAGIDNDGDAVLCFSRPAIPGITYNVKGNQITYTDLPTNQVSVIGIDDDIPQTVEAGKSKEISYADLFGNDPIGRRGDNITNFNVAFLSNSNKVLRVDYINDVINQKIIITPKKYCVKENMLFQYIPTKDDGNGHSVKGNLTYLTIHVTPDLLEDENITCQSGLGCVSTSYTCYSTNYDIVENTYPSPYSTSVVQNFSTNCRWRHLTGKTEISNWYNLITFKNKSSSYTKFNNPLINGEYYNYHFTVYNEDNFSLNSTLYAGVCMNEPIYRDINLDYDQSLDMLTKESMDLIYTKGLIQQSIFSQVATFGYTYNYIFKTNDAYKYLIVGSDSTFDGVGIIYQNIHPVDYLHITCNITGDFEALNSVGALLTVSLTNNDVLQSNDATVRLTLPEGITLDNLSSKYTFTNNSLTIPAGTLNKGAITIPIKLIIASSVPISPTLLPIRAMVIAGSCDNPLYDVANFNIIKDGCVASVKSTGIFYPTIQEAITNAAASGDEVLICQGLHQENLIIDKPITLSSYYDGTNPDMINYTILNPLSTLPAITILPNTNNVVIKGFSIRGNGTQIGIVTSNTTTDPAIIQNNNLQIDHMVLDNLATSTDIESVNLKLYSTEISNTLQSTNIAYSIVDAQNVEYHDNGGTATLLLTKNSTFTNSDFYNNTNLVSVTSNNTLLGTLIMTNCNFYSNTASLIQKSIFYFGAMTNLGFNSCSFHDNTLLNVDNVDYVKIIDIEGSINNVNTPTKVSFDNCLFNKNSSPTNFYKYCVFASNTNDFSITNSTFNNNNIGEFYLNTQSILIDKCEIIECKADILMDLWSPNTDLKNSLISNNIGIIRLFEGSTSVIIDKTIFESNTCSSSVSFISAWGVKLLIVKNSKFINNDLGITNQYIDTPNSYGSILFTGNLTGDEMFVENCLFSHNKHFRYLIFDGIPTCPCPYPSKTYSINHVTMIDNNSTPDYPLTDIAFAYGDETSEVKNSIVWDDVDENITNGIQTIENTIVRNGTSGLTTQDSDPDVMAEINTYYTTPPNVIFDFTPEFETDSYRPLIGGNLVDKGVATSVTTDIDGNLRMGLPDLGAYESGYSDPIPVSVGSTLKSDYMGSETTVSSMLNSKTEPDIKSIQSTTEQLHIYPVPSHDKIVIDAGNILEPIQQIEITDVVGKIITTIVPIQLQTEVDISSYSNGIYFVKVTSATKSITGRFVKN